MDAAEKTLASRLVYDGRVLRLRVDTVALPDGREALREVAEHPGGVAVVAIDGEGRVLTVKQYRYVFSRVLEELPAGKLERGEDPRAAALRELKEETGATPARFTALGELIVSPGAYGEVLHLYLAEELTFGAPSPDEDEYLELVRTPLDELARRALSGELTDAKTVAGILKVYALRRLGR
ncbi:MAG: NUDIX hydrolase [Oscillospiraceae bacterium]|nr:NUDIX hydrolase [Oscillospiraceae bacterium]